MLVIVKPLLIERVVAVLALNPWSCGMTLALMVGQGLKGGAKVVAVQSSLRVNDFLLVMTFYLILMTLLIISSFYIESWMVVHQECRPWAYSFQVPDKLHFLRSLATTSLHRYFYPPVECFPPAGAHTRSCLGSRSLGFLEMCLKKKRWSCKRMLCNAHSDMALLLHDWDTQDHLKATDHKGLKAANMGLRRTMLSRLYSKVGRMTLFRMWTLVVVWIFCWHHKMWDSKWNTDEALHI